MTAQEVLTTLRSLGTEQNRKIYARHGARANTYGVSFANLEKIRKEIKRDHALATELWKTGNFDACNLATMIADPAEMSAKDLDDWVGRMEGYCVADLFARNIAAKTPFAKAKVDKWTKSKQELIGEAGYQLLACMVLNDREIEDAYFERWISIIERGIHKAPNRVRHSMNIALIAIGVRNARLRDLALTAAVKIGKVTVDHGETSCKTPDAAAYIQKTSQRAAAKKAGR